MTTLSDEAITQIIKKAGVADVDESEYNVTLEDIDELGSKENILDSFQKIADYNKMIAEKITFINEALTDAVPFTRENLYLICAYTGSGKSTIAANITYPLFQQKKKTLVISNEESKQDVLFRIACLELGYNFNEYKKGKMPQHQQLAVMKRFPEIMQYVAVLDVNYRNGLTTKLEGVKAALESVKAADYSCVMIDYYQLIRYSMQDPNAGTFKVLDDFRIYLGQYIKKSNIPVVVFAQLHSIGKRQNKDLDSRIKDCPPIIEPSTVIIEVVPNFDDKTSDFIIHKDRFGMAGHRVACAFEYGRFVSMSDDDMLDRKAGIVGDIIDDKKEAPSEEK